MTLNFCYLIFQPTAVLSPVNLFPLVIDDTLALYRYL